jgi:AcrR family transcriptional regulator
MAHTSPDDARRSGRRPGTPDTRRDILDSARRLLAGGGCGSTSMRAVARDAGVDAALVVHYFGSKEGLLREALRPGEVVQVDFDALVDEDLDRLGERLVSAFLDEIDAQADHGKGIAVVLGLGMEDPLAAELVSELMVDGWTAPLGAALERATGAPDAGLRAQLAATQMVALVVSRRLGVMEQLTDLDGDEIVRRYGAMVQCALTGVASNVC